MQDIEEVYKRYANTVYKYVFCLTGKEDIAEEITQETFEVAVRDINKFKGTCKISVWLCQIAKFIWYRELRKKNKRKIISMEEIGDTLIQEDNMEDSLCLKEEKMELFKKMQNLNGLTKEVMYLKIAGDLSFIEIAEILNKSPNWVRVTFCRGKQKLREVEKNERM